jgi:hypothetical protein
MLCVAPHLVLFASLLHGRLSRTERKILKLLRQGSAVLLMGRSGTGEQCCSMSFGSAIRLHSSCQLADRVLACGSLAGFGSASQLTSACCSETWLANQPPRAVRGRCCC